MSVIQLEDLVTYQLRTSYLSEVADGVGERLITLNESVLNSAPFKAAGWRTNPAHIKRTHSPPIPTAVASEYFQAPRSGLTLEDDQDDGGILAGGGPDTMGPGTAKRRRRRLEQAEEDDSSDLSDESDDEPDQRAAQQIKFAKMPVRHRSGSSPIQSSNLRQSTTVASPKAPPRRGSQSALETVKERARRDTVTSSEVSSDNEVDPSGAPPHREGARTKPPKTVRIQPSRLGSEPQLTGVKRQESDLLEEEEEDDSDASFISSVFAGSIDPASMLHAADNPLNASPRQQIVGTPPREFTRSSTIRRSQHPAIKLQGELPPPRPVSMVRPLSMIQPRSLLSDALKQRNTKPAIPFASFAPLSGQGDPNPIMVRIYAPASNTPTKPFEVLIRRMVNVKQGENRQVEVADLIGLALWRYNEEKLEPPLPDDKLNVNWWTLRIVEEGGEVDDDFPPLERTKLLTSFTTANNRPKGRMRSNSKVYDDFALMQASQSEFAQNEKQTPQFKEESRAEETTSKEDETMSRAATLLNVPTPQFDQSSMQSNLLLTPQSGSSLLVTPSQGQNRINPILNTPFRPKALPADKPTPKPNVPPMQRGRQKLLRVHLNLEGLPPGQMVTLDVTTDTYFEDVLDLLCKKRRLDKSTHVLRNIGAGEVIALDRDVASLGSMSEIEVHRKRIAGDTPSSMLAGSPGSGSPKLFSFGSEGHHPGGRGKFRKNLGTHPLANMEALQMKELGTSKRYVVQRKAAMKIMGSTERVLTIDGEYLHIMPSSGGKALVDGGSKATTTVHFSNVVGCKVSRRHADSFKLVIYKATESKRYDFEAKSAEEAAEIVQNLKKGISPYREIVVSSYEEPAEHIGPPEKVDKANKKLKAKSKIKFVVGPDPETEPEPEPESEPEKKPDDFWLSFGTRKKDKKKKRPIFELGPPPPPEPEPVSEPDKKDDDFWSSFGARKKDKKKKEQSTKLGTSLESQATDELPELPRKEKKPKNKLKKEKPKKKMKKGQIYEQDEGNSLDESHTRYGVNEDEPTGHGRPKYERSNSRISIASLFRPKSQSKNRTLTL